MMRSDLEAFQSAQKAALDTATKVAVAAAVLPSIYAALWFSACVYMLNPRRSGGFAFYTPLRNMESNGSCVLGWPSSLSF
jgi:ABC-type nickel/cobalt efflux system permease component RcnA